MPEMNAYALPIYEAVVCGLALDKIRQEETDHRGEEFLSGLFKAHGKLKEVIDVFSTANFSKTSRPDIEFVAAALVVLLTITRGLIASLGQGLDENSDQKYRSTVTTALDDMAASEERLEQITESWLMALDETAVNEIKQAVAQSHEEERGVSEISDWREVLASIKD